MSCETFFAAAVNRLRDEQRYRVFAAGRILNAKTARSQMLGGMIWGIGSALMEENNRRSALRFLCQPGPGELPCRGQRRRRRDRRHAPA
jgi:hypothetical protein